MSLTGLLCLCVAGGSWATSEQGRSKPGSGAALAIMRSSNNRQIKQTLNLLEGLVAKYQDKLSISDPEGGKRYVILQENGNRYDIANIKVLGVFIQLDDKSYLVDTKVEQNQGESKNELRFFSSLDEFKKFVEPVKTILNEYSLKEGRLMRGAVSVGNDTEETECYELKITKDKTMQPACRAVDSNGRRIISRLNANRKYVPLYYQKVRYSGTIFIGEDDTCELTINNQRVSVNASELQLCILNAKAGFQSSLPIKNNQQLQITYVPNLEQGALVMELVNTQPNTTNQQTSTNPQNKK